MSIDDDISFLEQVPTLRLLGRQALRIIAIGAESRYVQEGEALFRRGEPADGGYVVQQGSFALRENDEPGGTQEVIAGPATLLGEFAMIAETTRPVTAVARETSTVIRIPRNLFLKMLDGFPDIALKLRDNIAQRSELSTREMMRVRSILEPPEAPLAPDRPGGRD